MNQRLYGMQSNVALAVSEAAPDHFFMRKCGMQICVPEKMIEERVAERKLRGLPPFTKEQLRALRSPTVGHVKLIRGVHGEELLQGVLDCFSSKLFDLVGLDSVSACLPMADAKKDLDDNTKRAAAAGLLTEFFQHYLNGTTGYTGANPTTVIFTAQVRANSKKAEAPAHIAKYLPDFAPQGAYAAKHGKLIDILLTGGAKEKEKQEYTPLGQTEAKEKRVQTGKTVRYEILKGKAGVHEGITGEFDFHFPANSVQMHDPTHLLTDAQRLVIMEGIRAGVAEEEGGLITFYDLSQPTPVPLPGLEKIAGIGALAEMMRADFELDLQLRRYVLNAVGIECAYR